MFRLTQQKKKKQINPFTKCPCLSIGAQQVDDSYIQSPIKLHRITFIIKYAQKAKCITCMTTHFTLVTKTYVSNNVQSSLRIPLYYSCKLMLGVLVKYT